MKNKFEEIAMVIYITPSLPNIRMGTGNSQLDDVICSNSQLGDGDDNQIPNLEIDCDTRSIKDIANFTQFSMYADELLRKTELIRYRIDSMPANVLCTDSRDGPKYTVSRTKLIESLKVGTEYDAKYGSYMSIENVTINGIPCTISFCERQYNGYIRINGADVKFHNLDPEDYKFNPPGGWTAD